MILQAVPTNDSDDDEFREDVSLYGRRAESGDLAQSTRSGAPEEEEEEGGREQQQEKKRKQRRGGRLKQKAREVAASAAEGNDRGCRRVAFASICFCLGVLGVGTSLALLRRLRGEARRFVALGGPVVALFSYSPNTDAAVAWLGAALLTGQPPNVTREETPFAPGHATAASASQWFLPDGKLVRIWRPPVVGDAIQIRALAHGGVSGMLRRVHGFGPPRVLDLSQLAKGKHGRASVLDDVPEADAFLAMRALLAADDESIDSAEADADVEMETEAGEEGETKSRRRHRPPELVLVSHPHHIPYLAALARASGFRPLGLDPSLYSEVPWADFGCNDLGYAVGVSPQEAVQREVVRLSSFVQSLNSGDEQHLGDLQPIFDKANRTLTFDICVVTQVAKVGPDSGAAAYCGNQSGNT